MEVWYKSILWVISVIVPGPTVQSYCLTPRMLRLPNAMQLSGQKQIFIYFLSCVLDLLLQILM